MGVTYNKTGRRIPTAVATSMHARKNNYPAAHVRACAIRRIRSDGHARSDERHFGMISRYIRLTNDDGSLRRTNGFV